MSKIPLHLFRLVLTGVLLICIAMPAGGAGYNFTDVTNTAGVANSQMTEHFGATWCDYDSDGLLDLYVVNGCLCHVPDPLGANTLYRNNGDGSFTDVTVATGAGDQYEAMRNVWADFDRDGDQDFYSHNFAQSTLYRNDGNVFTNINQSSGAGVQLAFGTGAGWADYDNDGYVDLHLTSFPGENALLHNNGDGTFSEVRAAAGFPLPAAGMGNAWGDFNDDGFQDVAVAAVPALNDFAFLYRNNGNGTFSDISTAAGIVLEPGSSTAAVSWGDYDNDTDLDLLISEVQKGSLKVLPHRLYLFRNNGNETFTDVTVAAQLTTGAGSTEFWEASWADHDNDGDLDLFIGGVGIDMFFDNNGDGTFTDIAPQLGLDSALHTHGGIWGDYDNDSDLDLYIVRKFDPNTLWSNDGGSNHWLQIELHGTVSNLDAIGARLIVTSGGTTRTREINGGTGFFSQHSPIQQVGLGSNTQGDVQIIWPSGHVDLLQGVAADQRITIFEAPASGPNIVVPTSAVLFGDVTQGSFLDRTVSIHNTGSGTLNVSSLMVTGGEFSVVSPAVPFSIASGGAAVDVTVRFSPSTLGLQLGNLEIASDDADQATLNVPLSGNGVGAGQSEIRINAGGPNFTDSNGDLFEADPAHVGGGYGYTGGLPKNYASPIAGTVDDPLYQDIRFEQTSFGYTFDNMSSGAYDVTLHLMDPGSTAAGQLLMDVTIEGVLVLDDLDVFAATGAIFTAHTQTLRTSVSDGQLNIDFTRVVGSAASVAALSVVSAPSPGPVADGSFGTAMHAGRTGGGATSIQVDWDVVSCQETGYQILYGPLGSVGAHALSGGECGLTSSGTHLWSGVPAGDLWFVVTSHDGSGVEGSWGQQSGSVDRAAGVPSGQCSNLQRDDLGTCP